MSTFSQKFLQCFLNLPQKTRFVYFLEAERKEQQQTFDINSNVIRDIAPYLAEISATEKPEEWEKIIENALDRVADKYKDDVAKAAIAKKTALNLLIDKACDIDGDGKILTEKEKKLRSSVNLALASVIKQIDDEVAASRKRISDIASTTAGLKEDVEEGEDLDISRLTIEAQKAYSRYKEAKAKAAKLRQEVGLVDGLPPTADNIILSLHKKATESDDDEAVLLLVKEGTADFAAKKAAEIIAADAEISHSRAALIAAIDTSGAKAAEVAKKGGKKEVEARGLAFAIDKEKARIMKEEAKEGHVAEAGKALDDTEKKHSDAEVEVRTAKAAVDDAEADLKKALNGCGLELGDKIISDAVILAWYKKATRENDRETILKLMKENTEQLANKKVAELMGLQKKHNEALAALDVATRKEESLARAVENRESALKLAKRGVDAGADVEVARETGAARRKRERQAEALANLKRIKDQGVKVVEGAAGLAQKGKSAVAGVLRVKKEQERVAATPRGPEDIGKTVHVVEKGNTMIGIARKYYGVSNLEFALKLQENSLGPVKRLKDGRYSAIHVGEEIKLPDTFEGKKRLI